MAKISDFQRQYVVGEEGETIFHLPIHDFMVGIEDQLKPDGMLSTLNRMEGYKDDRSKVLLASLASESIIEKLLEALMPRYKPALDNERDTTFSMKIKILKALSIVPLHLTEAADIIRVVRNRFAHDLTVEDLGDIDEKAKDRMQQFYARRKIDPKDKRDDLAHVFDVIAHIATAGLSNYLPLVRDLNDTIRQPEFEAALRKQAEQRQRDQIKIILEHVQQPVPDRSEPFI